MNNETTIKPSKFLDEEITKAQKAVDWLKENSQRLWIVEQLEERFKELMFAKYVDPIFNSVGMTFNFTDMTQATEVIKVLTNEYGLHQTSSMIEDTSSKRRCWFFNGFILAAYFNQEGATCKYVQVGTKEVPVYEMKCEGKDEV